MARHYSTAFKQEAIRLLATGMPVGEAAHALEMPPMTLWGWYYRVKGEGLLEEEPPILGKVSAFFAKQRQT